MSADREPPAAEPARTIAPRRARRPPGLRQYALLNLGAWAFLAFQAWILTLAFGDSRAILLFSLLLAAGILLASVFDFIWTRRE